MEKKKYRLREHFSLDLGSEVVMGPRIVEIDEKTAAANAHKLEDVAPEPKGKGAKQDK